MKTRLFSLAVAAIVFAPCAHARPERAPDAQQLLSIDLHACPRPAYPGAALARGAGGKTTVEVQIGEQGLVTEGRVSSSSGSADLDQAALAAVRRCVFHTLLAAGHTPTGWLKTQYVWIPGQARQAAARNQALFDSTTQRAAAGDALAQNRLGTWYQNGTYGSTDLAQAAHWYRLAADQGNAYAQNNLGVLYYRGAGVARDQTQAVYWYAKAAEQGHGWAQANLAWAYQFGSAGEKDIDKALHWLTEAAGGGLPAAQVRLGLLAMQRAGTDEARSAASAWLARAAAQQYPAGLYYLGRTFELGLGNAQDDAQAAALYRQALGRSDGRAETALGSLLETGRAGHADVDQAARLYQQAMHWRYPAAYSHYASVLAQRGEAPLARAVLREAAQMGDCDAALQYAQERTADAAPAGVSRAGGVLKDSAATAVDAALDQRIAYCKARPAAGPQL